MTDYSLAKRVQELAIMSAPDPTEGEIEKAIKHDANRSNPMRSRMEIVLDYKLAAYRMLQRKLEV